MKRTRTQSSSPSPDRSETTSPQPKHTRPEHEAAKWQCTLGPICGAVPRTFPTQAALQSHYITEHSFICRGAVRGRDEDQGQGDGTALGDGDEGVGVCGKVFPEERLLELVRPSFLAFALASWSSLIFPCSKAYHREPRPNSTNPPIPRSPNRASPSLPSLCKKLTPLHETKFECLLPRNLCGRRFQTPRERRNHMIKTHRMSSFPLPLPLPLFAYRNQ